MLAAKGKRQKAKNKNAMERSVFQVTKKELKPFISDFFIVGFKTVREGPTLVPPLGFPVLQFHFGEKSKFYNRENLPDESIFIGQLTKHINLFPVTGTQLMGINFKPYGLYNLFGISPAPIIDSGFESKIFFGEKTIKRTIEQLQEAPAHEERIDIVEQLLADNMDATKTTANPFFDEIVDQIVDKHGLVNPSDLLGGKSSLRSFERYFQKSIGVPPKLFCQILRHKHILQNIYINPELNWQDSILLGYYYDHSHFSRDFQKFSGQKPLEYIPMRNDFAAHLINSGS